MSWVRLDVRSMLRINELGLRCKCQCYVSMSGVGDVGVNVAYQ